jgi:hypothetical protein
MAFYAYIHCKPDGTPFYVGKGKLARVRRIRRPHNKKHEMIVGECGVQNVLVGKLECSSEAISYELERGLIKRLGLMGFDMVNLTEGGGGVGGFKMPENAKQKIRKALIGRKFSESHIKNLTKSLRGRKLPPIGDGHKKSISESNSRVKLGNKYTLGLVWVTNGIENRMVDPSVSVADGWKRGMTRDSKK